MTSVCPDLKDTSGFVTAGGTGIGARLTAGYVAQGAKVALAKRSDGFDFVNVLAKTAQVFFKTAISNATNGLRPKNLAGLTLFLGCDAAAMMIGQYMIFDASVVTTG